MRNLLASIFLTTGILVSCSVAEQESGKVPVVVITDLYAPAQDPDDNFDILLPYAVENIDLKAVVFDVTEDFRKPGPRNDVRRDPGFIPVTQLNYLFDTDVPCGCAPFAELTSEDDAKMDASAFETKGIDLLFEVLEQSDRPVHIVSTGSCRPLAVAYNRNPRLMTSSKVAKVHVIAGASSPDFVEWNIALDTLAAARVLKSDMNMAIYPCATEHGAFDLGRHNAYWGLRTLDFIPEMEGPLGNYCVYSLLSQTDIDYLSYLDVPLSDEDAEALDLYWRDASLGCRHHIWTVATWQQVAGLKLVTGADGNAVFKLASEIQSDDVVFDEGLEYVSLDVKDNGVFSFEYSDQPTNVQIYYRSDPAENERLLNMALPELYRNFKTD